MNSFDHHGRIVLASAKLSVLSGDRRWFFQLVDYNELIHGAFTIGCLILDHESCHTDAQSLGSR